MAHTQTIEAPRRHPRQRLWQGILALWENVQTYARQPVGDAKKVTWRDWLLAAVLFASVGLLRVIALALDDDARGVQYFFYDWDGKNYLAIAEYGYFTADGTGDPDPAIYERRLAFFPALPMLMRAGNQLFGLEYHVVGLGIAQLAGWLTMVGIMVMVARMGYGLRERCFGVLLFLGAPMAITMHMVYTEPLYLMLLVWAAVALHADKLGWAAILIFASGFTRLTAIDLVIAFGVVVFLRHRRSMRAWAYVVFSSLSIVGYLIWVSLVSGDSGSYFEMQRKGWSSSFDLGLSSVRWIFGAFSTGQTWGHYVAAACIIGSVAVAIFAWQRMPFAYWIMATGVVANVVLSGGFLYSRPRLLLVAMVLALPLVQYVQRWPAWLSRGLLGLWLVHSLAFGTWMMAYSQYAI
ncbi:MAG: hypothetical protein Q3976_03015 [Corynebacterium sp.]|nr:hypothetical protein [Corynebacterium sp.]